MKGNIFIKRPVMALSISVLILIVGFISLYTLPVEQYPDIAPPTVRVEATYTGVNADAVMSGWHFRKICRNHWRLNISIRKFLSQS
jgi:hydrophobic/amphiphilic exporter-1 (mainly G- bacteria), HAE1 family